MKLLKRKLDINRLTISHVMQPIIDLSNDKVVGYEFLLRSKNYQNPEMLFQTAMGENRLLDLDTMSVHHILELIEKEHDRLQNMFLFINVYPSTLVEYSFYKGLLELVSRKNINPKSIVFEINESDKEINLLALKEAVNTYKKYGFVISLDDVGKGESTLKVVLETEPDIVKLDRYFAKDLANLPRKQEVLKHFLSLFKDSHTRLVLEGIENQGDLTIAKSIGFDFGQGFYLGKPNPLDFWMEKK